MILCGAFMMRSSGASIVFVFCNTIVSDKNMLVKIWHSNDFCSRRKGEVENYLYLLCVTIPDFPMVAIRNDAPGPGHPC